MTTLETTISSVAVYHDRARVTRAGRIYLEPGEHTLTISPLPASLIQDSVRASGRGKARLTGVEVAAVYAAEPQEGAAKAAQAEVERLQDQDRVLADEEEAWKQRLAVVKSIGAEGSRNLARSLARGSLSLDQLTILLDYLSQSHEAGSNILRDLAIRRRTLAREIEAAKQRAEQLASSAAREWREARVNLEAPEAGEVSLELTYAVKGANWEPLYDARLDDQTLSWTYLAQITQETGEDWMPPFDLILSTAELATGLDKPELPPWRLYEYQPPLVARAAGRGEMVRAMSAAQPTALASPAEAAAPPPMAHASVEVSSQGPAVFYTVRNPRPLPSDGKPHQVVVADLKFDAALDYITAPKVQEHAYLRARVRNNSPYVLLAGRASLYHGGDYVGSRSLETVAPGQAVELFLGADRRIKVERKEIERSVDKNLLGNTARTQLAYRISIQNLAPNAARVVVLDQIPVSQHPDIKVKLREATPRPAQENEQGELEWQLEVKPQERIEITFALTVEYPKELRISGL